jgi:2-phosphosulfolactate phosphatase
LGGDLVELEDNEGLNNVRPAKSVDLLCLPSEGERDSLHGKVAVIIDVLRASSTIVTALSNGCNRILPVSSSEDARVVVRSLPEKGFLLGGEENGVKISNFDLGNSPLEYSRDVVMNKDIVFTTTNGAKAIELAKKADEIVICTFLNISSASRYLLDELKTKGGIVIICAGMRGGYSVEDVVCGGMLVDLLQLQSEFTLNMNQAAREAHKLYGKFQANLLEMVSVSPHGRELKKLGFEKDLSYCAHIDMIDLVPIIPSGSQAIIIKTD